MNHRNIENIYYKWSVFFTLTVFLLSAVGIWWEFSKGAVGLVLLVAFTASNHLLSCSQSKYISSFHLIALFTFLFQVSSTFLVSVIPIFSYDEIAYSVSLPKDYVAAHKFYYQNNYGPYSAFPQNFETITSASLLFFGSPFLAKFINYVLGFGLILAANRIAAQCYISQKSSLLAGLFVGSSLVMITSLPIAKNDILNGFFQVWSLVFLIEYYTEKRLSFAIAIGVLLGSAIGTKYNSLIFSVVPISFFFGVTYLSSMSYKDKISRYGALILFLALSAFPWYLRNYIEFHNPFYPAFNELFIGENGFDKTYIDVFKEVFYDDIANFSWVNGSLFMFFKKHINSFGSVLSLLGFLGFWFALNFKDERRFLSLLLVSLTFITLRFGFWEPRYNICLLILISVFAAFFCDQVFEYLKKSYTNFNANLVINIVIIILCGVGFFRGLNTYKFVEYDYFFNRSSFFEKHVPYWKVANFLNHSTPKNSKIGVGFGANQMFYYLERPYYHFHPMTEKGNLLNKITPTDFKELMRSQHIDYLAISKCCSYGSIEGKTPVLSAFMKNFYEAISVLDASHEIQMIAEIDDVSVYRIIMAETK